MRDTGEHDGLPYLAAQFIEGIALDQKLEPEGRLDLATTVRICAQVADGLQALVGGWDGAPRRQARQHPARPDGNAYITDFGLAKDSAGTVLTRPGQPLGSMDYMPPEQIRGEPVTGAADIYSLGCVVFECVSGRPPFADREGMRVLWAHLQDEPPDPSAERTDISPEFAQALKAALRKEPAERPRTSIEYARSLSQAAGIPIVDAAG